MKSRAFPPLPSRVNQYTLTDSESPAKLGLLIYTQVDLYLLHSRLQRNEDKVETTSRDSASVREQRLCTKAFEDVVFSFPLPSHQVRFNRLFS